MLDAAIAEPLLPPAPDHPARCGSNSWIAIQSHPQAERWAEANLQRQGYATYLPLYAARARDRSLPTMFHTVERPLFSGYLFVQCDSPRAPIRSTRGVRRILGPIQNRDLEALRAGDEARRSLPAPDTLYAPGTPCVAILGGNPVEAVVVSVSREVATVSVMMLGGLREISVHLDSLASRD